MIIFINILSIAIIANFIVGVSTIIAVKFRLKEFKLKIVEGITLTIAPGVTYYHKANKKELQNLHKIRIKKIVRFFIPVTNIVMVYVCIMGKDTLFLRWDDRLEEVSE